MKKMKHYIVNKYNDGINNNKTNKKRRNRSINKSCTK